MAKAKYNICAIVQAGRLEYEALIFALSFFDQNPEFKGRLLFLEPQFNDAWDEDPRISEDVRNTLLKLGAEILPFENEVFGQRYPHGNKIEALKVVPEDQPFIFFDTDTLFTGPIEDVPFDFTRPSASLKREGTWPQIDLYGYSYSQIWGSLYQRFGLDFEASLNFDWPEDHWRRYLYFNAGFFYYQSASQFHALYLKYAREIDEAPHKEIETQSLNPWLDQVTLPLVIHALGGARDALPDGFLDGKTSCHYRVMSLLYATQPQEITDYLEDLVAHNKYKKLLKLHEPFKKLIYQRKGHKIREVFDINALPRKEAEIRKRLKNNKLWFR